MKVALKPAQWTVFRSEDRFGILAGETPVRKNVLGPNGVVPGRLGTESAGMVRGADLPASQANRLEGAA